jgi:hypothetical protein
MFWVKRLFCQCIVWKDFTMFCNNFIILFDDDNDAWLAKELLGPTYLDGIWDEVSCHASGLQQKQTYEARLEKRIGSLQRGTSHSVMLLPSRNLLFAWAHIHNMAYPFLSWEEKLTFQSSTRKRKGNKNAKRKVLVSKLVLWKGIVCPHSIPVNSNWILIRLLLSLFKVTLCQRWYKVLTYSTRSQTRTQDSLWWWWLLHVWMPCGWLHCD